MFATNLPVFGNSSGGVSSELALKGGKPVRTEGWLDWPVWDQEAEKPMLELLRSGDWFRGDGRPVFQSSVQVRLPRPVPVAVLFGTGKHRLLKGVSGEWI